MPSTGSLTDETNKTNNPPMDRAKQKPGRFNFPDRYRVALKKTMCQIAQPKTSNILRKISTMQWLPEHDEQKTFQTQESFYG